MHIDLLNLLSYFCRQWHITLFPSLSHLLSFLFLNSPLTHKYVVTFALAVVSSFGTSQLYCTQSGALWILNSRQVSLKFTAWRRLNMKTYSVIARQTKHSWVHVRDSVGTCDTGWHLRHDSLICIQFTFDNYQKMTTLLPCTCWKWDRAAGRGWERETMRSLETKIKPL